MAEKITVPTLGESVTEATVSKWLKSQGEKVSADEPLVELETDKVNVEVPSPVSGVLGSISVKEGEIFGIAGVAGNGQSELMSLLTGEGIRGVTGSLIYNSVDIKNFNPKKKT